MKRILAASAAIFLSTAASAGTTFPQITSETESENNWRVMVMVGQAAEITGGTALDSFPVPGDRDNCRQIATTMGSSWKLSEGTALGLFCLDASTGELALVDTWSH